MVSLKRFLVAGLAVTEGLALTLPSHVSPGLQVRAGDNVQKIPPKSPKPAEPEPAQPPAGTPETGAPGKDNSLLNKVMDMAQKKGENMLMDYFFNPKDDKDDKTGGSGNREGKSVKSGGGPVGWVKDKAKSAVDKLNGKYAETLADIRGDGLNGLRNPLKGFKGPGLINKIKETGNRLSQVAAKPDSTTWDYVAAATKVVPFVGCFTENEAKVKEGMSRKEKWEADSEALNCLLFDWLMVTPLAAYSENFRAYAKDGAKWLNTHLADHSREIRAALRQAKEVQGFKNARDRQFNKIINEKTFPAFSSSQYGKAIAEQLSLDLTTGLGLGAARLAFVKEFQDTVLESTKDQYTEDDRRQFDQYVKEKESNVRADVSKQIVDKQRQVLLEFVNKMINNDTASLSVIANMVQESFMKDSMPEEASKEIRDAMANSKPTLPSPLTVAYIVGQSLAIDERSAGMTIEQIEQRIYNGSTDGNGQGKVFGRQQPKGDSPGWQIHPFTLNHVEYFKRQGMNKAAADAEALKQMTAVVKVLTASQAQKKVNFQEEIEKSMNKWRPGKDYPGKKPDEKKPAAPQQPAKSTPQKRADEKPTEYQLLAAMAMGRKLKGWKRNADESTTFFSGVADPMAAIPSVLGSK